MNRDPFVLVPNATGVSLGLGLMVLKLIFWKRTPATKEASAAVGEVVLDGPEAEGKPAAPAAAKPDADAGADAV
jgi:hypothetical protein